MLQESGMVTSEWNARISRSRRLVVIGCTATGGYLVCWIMMGWHVARNPAAALGGGYLIMLGLPWLAVMSILFAMIVDLGYAWHGAVVVLVTASGVACVLTGAAAGLGAALASWW